MPARTVDRPAQRQQLVTGTLGDADPTTISRLVGEIADAHEDLAARHQPRDQQVADLVVGANVLNHGLGRRPLGCNVTPTVADATFAWAMTARDERTVTITAIGVPQPKATVEVF